MVMYYCLWKPLFNVIKDYHRVECLRSVSQSLLIQDQAHSKYTRSRKIPSTDSKVWIACVSSIRQAYAPGSLNIAALDQPDITHFMSKRTIARCGFCFAGDYIGNATIVFSPSCYSELKRHPQDGSKYISKGTMKVEESTLKF